MDILAFNVNHAVSEIYGFKLLADHLIFSVSLAQTQWVVTSYLLMVVALLPLLGQISDRLDRPKIYSIGFLIFSIGSLPAALSTGLTVNVAYRCLQGIGAAMIMANS